MQKNEKIKVAIFGYGNIGKAVEEAVSVTNDMTLTGIFHHDEMDRLQACQPDIVLLGVPSREVPKAVEQLLKTGLNTVDSFDIHTQIPTVHKHLDEVARQNKAVSILSAGWDPGSDSMVRALMQALVPQGVTFTDFGPGRSMGHTVAAKNIEGVKDALSMTIPLGTGIHRRMVYVELKEGYSYEKVRDAILHDDYFAHDETHVIEVDNVKALNNVAHGVHLSRNGVSGTTHNQRIELTMSINNPALTGQIMVATARAAMRMAQRGQNGCYTMIELAPVDLLEGEKEEWIKRLV
ncbi:MAG: diaminopimelate dehydrogenase [Paludibacteraceae bacterium]|nr:diaminopimelate dehydrogenase [Paludibacteraceae bacterium]